MSEAIQLSVPKHADYEIEIRLKYRINFKSLIVLLSEIVGFNVISSKLSDNLRTTIIDSASTYQYSILFIFTLIFIYIQKDKQ